MADEIKAENVLTGKVDENSSELPYHNKETQKIAEEREAELGTGSGELVDLMGGAQPEYPKTLDDGRVIVTESGKTQEELDAEVAKIAEESKAE